MPEQHPHSLALVRQRELIAQIGAWAGQIGNDETTAVVTMRQKLGSMSDIVYSATEQTCSQLLHVSAGFAGILQLLELWSEHLPECRSLHCLAIPLKTQLDQATGDLQRML